MAGELPPDTTSRSQSISLPPLEPGSLTTACSSLPRPSASTTVAPRRTRTPRRSSALNAGLEPLLRRSATVTSSTPASISASAASRPRSQTVATTAREPGFTAHSAASRRAPPDSITPGRSLPANSSGCSIVPVAYTWRRART